MPQITKSELKFLHSFIPKEEKSHHEQKQINDLIERLLAQPEVEPLEFLLDGMRVKLNFNKMGNMTSLSNMEHELQGRWVCFVGAENDKHLKATHPAPFVPITADMVTDEMISNIEDIVGMHWDVVRPEKLVAAVVNVWGGK